VSPTNDVASSQVDVLFLEARGVEPGVVSLGEDLQSGSLLASHQYRGS
jgi:hypothetical protein